MPYENYSDLIAEVRDLLARGDAGGKIPDWIRLAELTAVEELINLEDVLYEFSGTLTADDNSLILPVGLTSVERFQLDTVPPKIIESVTIRELGEQQKLNSAAANNFPATYAVVARSPDVKIDMQPVPSAAHPYTIFFKGLPVKMDEFRFTSSILQKAPQVLLYGAAMHAAVYFRNPTDTELFSTLFQTHLKIYGNFLGRANLDFIQMASATGPPIDGPQLMM